MSENKPDIPTCAELLAALEVCKRATPGPWLNNCGATIDCRPGYLADSGCIVAIIPDDIRPNEEDAEFIALARTLLPRALRALLERAEDTERLNKLEKLARAYCRHEFDADARFLVSDDGDVLSGVVKDYPHRTLRAAIDAAKEEK